MAQYFWDTQIEYLKTTRTQMWNDDYFAFLVRHVWELNKPINVVDFGCGYGFLGIKLLPLLAQGSIYTGIDKGKRLLAEAASLFAQSPYQAQFIEADLTEYVPDQQYDLAICQAVLRHIPSARTVLEKMIASVRPGGKVICIEVNRAMEESGFFSNAYIHNTIQNTAALKKKWDEEREAGGRDYQTGIKIPMYMHQMGMVDVQARVNDFVEMISPSADEQTDQAKIESMLQTRGLTFEYDAGTYVMAARCLLISYGTKPPANG